MGQKDITEKVLEDYNDVFADIINGLLFDGVQEIKPEALENTTVHAQYKAEDGKVHELERDIAKYWKEEKVELAICGIENQSKVEKNMPFRIVGYDGAAYRSQLQQERKKMLPVVTIVLYFGTDRHWNSRKKIKELMEIPRCLDTYVNDYQMLVLLLDKTLILFMLRKESFQATWYMNFFTTIELLVQMIRQWEKKLRNYILRSVREKL